MIYMHFKHSALSLNVILSFIYIVYSYVTAVYVYIISSVEMSCREKEFQQLGWVVINDSDSSNPSDISSQ